MWDIDYLPKVRRDLDRLDRPIQDQLTRFMEDRVAVRQDPRSLGAALRGPVLGNFWKYRVGDYRIVVDIRDTVRVIMVLDVGNRKEVYRRR
jgi:Cytotoxic translational repressor of toxin-antitoxin stability system